MFKRLLLGIIAVSALAMSWTEAGAQTCTQYRNVGGSRMCVKWTPGSEVCSVQVHGLTSADLDSNSEVTCEVREVTTGGGIPGTAFCVPSGTTDISAANTTANDACRHHFSGVGTGHLRHEDDCQGFPATLADGTIPSETQGLTQCDAKGVCKTLLKARSRDVCTNCCPPDFDFVTFTANQFRGAGGIVSRVRRRVHGNRTDMHVAGEQIQLRAIAAAAAGLIGLTFGLGPTR